MRALILFLSGLLMIAPLSDAQLVVKRGPIAAAGAATPTVSLKTAVGCSGSITTCATTSQTTTTGHDVAVGCFAGNQSTTLSVSDGTNTYTAVGTANITNNTLGASARVFVAKNITGVSHTIACNSTATAVGMNTFFYDLAGANTTTPVDVPTSGGTAGNQGTSATPSFTLPATTVANDLLLFFVECANTCSADGAADAGTSQSDGFGNESETYAKSATGTYTGSFSQTSGAFIEVGVAIAP